MRFSTIGIIGKSTVSKEDPPYIFIEELAYRLASAGCSIRHGGYSGGIMEAAARGAARAISESSFGNVLSIGIPEKRFDLDYPRTSDTQFIEPAEDICERLRGIILDSECIIVSPKGGDGTMLELQLAIHENRLGKYAGMIRPIIICELTGGTPWSALIDHQLKELDNGIAGMEDCPWMRIANSVDDVMREIALAEKLMHRNSRRD